MTIRKVPVEVAGYEERLIWTFDHTKGTAGFRRISWVNDDYDEDDFLPWDGDSSINDCPF